MSNEMKEATITVNGHLLTPAQSMTVRVGLGSFLMDMQYPEALGNDEVGNEIRRGYLKAGGDVLKLMLLSRQGDNNPTDGVGT